MLACYWTLNNSYLKKIKSYFKCQDYKSLKYIHGVSYNTMIPRKFHRMHFTDKQNGSSTWLNSNCSSVLSGT